MTYLSSNEEYKMSQKVLRFLSVSTVALLTWIGVGVNASADSGLSVEGDLLIQPASLERHFSIAAEQINASHNWNWPALKTSKPYRTSWQDVQAVGPFDVQIDASQLARQEIGFTFTWKDPKISVGQFAIKDVIRREIGGVPVVIHLDGSCTDMSLAIEGSTWVARGKLQWNMSNGQFTSQWSEFGLQMNGTPRVDVKVGKCQGPKALIDNLRETMQRAATDRAWMQDILKDGTGERMQTALTEMQIELMRARPAQLSPDTKLTWSPQAVMLLPHGRIRVAGLFQLQKTGAVKDVTGSAVATVPRGYDADSKLSALNQSGFVLPRATLAHVVSYLYQNGGLGTRVESTRLAAFTDLMRSRLMQFFVWPDLMQFRKRTVFYFDLSASGAAKMSDAVSTQKGGIKMNMQVPLVVHQWAPTSKEYLPYVDFKTEFKGEVKAQITGERLQLRLKPRDLNLSAGFRREYAKFRRPTGHISTSLIGTQLKDYLDQNAWSVTLPKWELGESTLLQLTDISADSEALLLPLEIGVRKN